MNASKAKSKWSRNAGSTQAVDSYKEGIAAVTENPMEAAANNAEGWWNGVQEAHDNDRFAKGCRNTPMTEWKSAAAGKGAANFSRGIKDGEAKYNRHVDRVAGIVSQVQAEVKAMPNRTQDERIARMVANARGMSRTRKTT